MTVAKIMIGYRTRLVPGAEKNLPDFKYPSNYKDAGKIAEYKKEAATAFLEDAKNMPYTGTFDEVYLADDKNNKAMMWSSSVDETKPPVSVRVRNYLLKYYPDVWNNDGLLQKGGPKAIIIGFNPRTFLKMLGLECSLPAINKPCPLGLWYSNIDHRDIEEAIMPKDFKGLTLAYVLKHRRPVDLEDAKHWDELLTDWPGPGTFPEKDALIATELATQLGFVERKTAPQE